MMVGDKTQEILKTFRIELKSKKTLFLAPVDSIISRIIYFYIYDMLKNETNRTVVWLCLKNQRDQVLKKFEEYGLDVKSFKERIWFVDVKMPEEPQENTLYCSSQTDYTKMASHIANLFADYPGSLLVIEDMNVLSSDNLQVVESFIQIVEKKVIKKEGTIVSTLGKGILPPEKEALIKSFFDVIIDITSGEIHTEIGLKVLDIYYEIKESGISLEYIEKKVKRERLKIMFVDDETEIPELVKISLASEPYDLIAAYSGTQAVELALKELPDLIFLDIMMPDMDGYEVVEKLKKSKVAADIPIIMISAKKEVEDKLKGMELGIDDYVTKPFDMRELNARIKMVMKRYGWTGAK